MIEIGTSPVIVQDSQGHFKKVQPKVISSGLVPNQTKDSKVETVKLTPKVAIAQTNKPKIGNDT